MRNLLLLLIISNLFAGCKPASEPVGSRPTQPELFGKWTLVNSPKLSGNPPIPIPTKGNSSILLTSNRVVKLTNVLVEEISPQAGKPWPYTTTLKTEEDIWDVEESGGLWSVMVNLKSQVIALNIKQRANAEFELSYQPDPERDPFIYMRDTKGKSK